MKVALARYRIALPFAVGLFAILAGLLFQWVLPERYQQNESPDYQNYYKPAGQALAEGDEFTTPAGSPAVRYPPGFPVLIAGLFLLEDVSGLAYDTLLSACLLLCGGITAALVFKTADLLWGSFWALLVALVWITYPIALWSAKQPNSEVPFMAVFCISFYVFLRAYLQKDTRPWPYVIAGVGAGVAMLIRPAAIAVGVLMSLMLMWRLRDQLMAGRLKLAGALLVGNIVIVAPWQVWVSRETNQFVLLSTGSVPSVLDGLTFAVVNPESKREEIALPSEVEAVQNDILKAEKRPESFGDIGTILFTQLKERPGGVLQLLLIKIARSWYGTDSMRLDHYILVLQLGYLALIGGAAWITFRRDNPARAALLPILVLTLYFWGMTTLVLSTVRYMLPALALLFVLLPALVKNRFMSNSRLQNLSA